MSEDHVDYAIVGTSPLALLVAGLLTAVHGRSVLVAGEGQAAYRLARGLDLSLAPFTRPETWAMLRACVPETLRTIARIGGRGAWSRSDPMFIADSESAREALSHIRHMALAYGHDVEPVAGYTDQSRDGILIRDAVLLHRPSLEPLLEAWLAQHNVRRIGGGERMTIAADGSALVETASGAIAIGQAVLADDAALIRHVSASDWPSLLERRDATTLLLAPTPSLAASMMRHIDSGVTVLQQPDGSVTAIGTCPLQDLVDQSGQMIGPGKPLHQSGQSLYQAVVARDGAMAVGRLSGTGPDVLAGLGSSGPFLAPAIARWLAGVASADENAYFGARLVNRDPVRSDVAEFGAVQ